MLGTHELERDFTAEGRLHGQVYNPHSAAAESITQLELSEARRNLALRSPIPRVTIIPLSSSSRIRSRNVGAISGCELKKASRAASPPSSNA